jgi:hypothetical protein
MKKNTSRRPRLAPSSATSDSSSTSGVLEEVLNSMQRYTSSMERVASSVVSSLEAVTGSGGEIRGEAATTQSHHARGHEKIQLSTFDPKEDDVRDWITDVERAREMYGWDEYETMHRVSPYLVGEALEWCKGWKVSDRKWSNFVIELRCSFPRRIDFGMRFEKAAECKSSTFPSYASYARTKLAYLNRLNKNLTDSELVSVICRGIECNKTRDEVKQAQKQSVSDLISLFCEFDDSGKNPADARVNRDNRVNTPSRVSRPEISKRCFSCGRRGHLKNACSAKVQSADGALQSSEPPIKKAFKLERCDFCHKVGHSEERCFAKQRSQGRNEKSVKFLCSGRSADCLTAIICGIPVDALIDTGAELSLVGSAVVRKLQLQPRSCSVPARTINSEVKITEKITLVVEFPELAVEADFYIIPEMTDPPLLIGTDILNKELISFHRKPNGEVRLFKNKLPGIMNLNLGKYNEPQTIKTNNLERYLPEDPPESLKDLISEFQSLFTTGTACSTVTTSELKIRLTTDVPIRYRPYRLSYAKKYV